MRYSDLLEKAKQGAVEITELTKAIESLEEERKDLREAVVTLNAQFFGGCCEHASDEAIIFGLDPKDDDHCLQCSIALKIQTAMNEDRGKPFKMHCGACSREKHEDCSNWCYCDCPYNK